MRVLHVAPHPDDELLGAPATLIALAEAGHDVVNLAVSLGRAEQRMRRERELRDACSRVGFALRLCTPPLSIGLRDDRAAAQARLVEELLGSEGVDLLVAPSPHDGHHGHEVVGRAAVAAAAELDVPLWLWGLWSDLALPTILHPFGTAVLERIEQALCAHAGELIRNDYLRLPRARAELIGVLGPERVFGFGAPGAGADALAEVLCEVVPQGSRLLLGHARVLDPRTPLAAPTDKELGPWLHASSVRDALGRDA